MSTNDRPTADAIAAEARRVLDAVAKISAEGGQPTLTAVRKSVQEFISFRLSEFVSYLERFGMLEFRRADGTVVVTEDGQRAIQGVSGGLVGSVVEHFGERVSASAAPPPAPTVEEVLPASPAPPQHEEIAAAPAAATEEQEPNVSHEDQFERGEALGTGGLAVVYRAKQLSLKRTVVVKEFSDIFQYFTPDQRSLIVNRLAEVVCLQARLSHPHIVRILDFDPHGLHPTIAVEYQPGGNLRDLMKSGDRMPVALAVQYFLQIAEALRYAHSQGVIHRNLKPENVLLDGTGNAVISDFGLTKIVERDDDNIRQVYVGVGTVAYLAPEQYQDARNSSPQGDIYSLGIMLYEMLTGKLPGRRSPMPSAYYDDVPVDLDDVFDKMTMDFLDVRYESMEEVLADLYASSDIMAKVERKAPVLFTSTPAAASAAVEEEAAPEEPAPAAASDRADSAPSDEAEPDAEPDGELPEPPAEAADDSAAAGAASDEESESAEPADEPAESGSMASRLDDLAGDLFGD